MDREQQRYFHQLHGAWRGLYDAAQLASCLGYDHSADDLIGMARLVTAMSDDLVSGEVDRGPSARQARYRQARIQAPLASNRLLAARRTSSSTPLRRPARPPGSSPQTP